MLLEHFVRETRYLSIGHFYFDAEKLEFFSKIKNTHPKVLTYDLTQSLANAPMVDILFVELGESTKDKLKLLLSLFTKHKPIIIYIFADDVENKLLLKFALHFGITDVLPFKNDTSLLDSIFSKNSNKLDDRLYIFQKIELEKKIEHFFPFMVFQGETLTYANAKAKMLYETNDLNELQSKVFHDQELYEALCTNEDAQGEVSIETASNQKELFLCIIKSFATSDEKIVTLIPYEPMQNAQPHHLVLNRFDFIDKFKDRLAQQSVTNANLSLIFVNITNLDKLNKTFANSLLYESFKHLVDKLLQLKEEGQELIQWSQNLYVLMNETNTFVHACEQTRHIQQELIRATSMEKITPVIISSALEVRSNDLNEMINFIEKVDALKLTPQDIDKINYFELEYLDESIDEKEQIAYLMHNCINNKIPIKLLNIYKGLCISTSSQILKITQDSFYMSCENLQGYAMQIEGETVLQAPNFPKDIKAEISLVDIKRSLVILKNLRFLSNSANSRQHTRVQTSVRTPVLIKYAQRSSAQGDIIDISVNSIAMRISKAFPEDEMLNQKVRLNFSLPNEAGENGYVVMDIEAKITFIAQKGDHSKVVAMVENLPKPYDDYLLRYMYTRQKELITEIKRATKAYN